MALARMRLIGQVFEYISELDPDTALTDGTIRKLVKEERIPVTKVGNKTLINLDHIDKLLEEGFEIESKPRPKTTENEIRTIKAV